MGRIIYWKEGWFVLFTGIIEEVGTVKKITRGTHSAVLHIAASTVLQGTKPGDSIAVNGICLTVTKLSNEIFSADVMHETLDRSSLGGLFVGIGVGLVVRQGGSSGGDDALALVISKLSRCRLSRAYLVTDLSVLLLSLTYIPFQRIAYSLVTVTVSSLLIDWIQNLGRKKPGEDAAAAGEAQPLQS